MAESLKGIGLKDPVIMGIPRGGVAVAKEVSLALNSDLDIVLSHKLGAPFNPELAIGAVAEDGGVILDKHLIQKIGVSEAYIKEEGRRQGELIKDRIISYRQALPKLSLKNRVVIIVDDGIATGATMQASLWIARQEKPKKLIAALPVAPKESIERLSSYCDMVIVLRVPEFFSAVSQFYENFSQVSDEEVADILKNARQRRG